MNQIQLDALRSISERYKVPFAPEHFHPQFDLPPGYVAGWVGGPNYRRLYVGISPEGEISS